MTKTKRIESVAKLAESAEMDAAKELAISQRQLDTAQAQLHQLMSYREEYLLRMREVGKQGMSIGQMQGYQAFISRLDLGIEEQRLKVDRARVALEQKRGQWQSRHMRSQAMDKVLSQYQQKERLLLNKRDQKDTDERGQRYSGVALLDD
ncbi:MAG: flagellar export protein FliJ [Pseudomonadota bacterium]